MNATLSAPNSDVSDYREQLFDIVNYYFNQNRSIIRIPKKDRHNICFSDCVFVKKNAYNNSSSISNSDFYCNLFPYQENLTIMSDSFKIKYDNAFSQLNMISDLKEDWNNNGAHVFSSFLIEKCKRILKQLSVEPGIFPTACNAVQFEYEKENGEYLEFEIYDTNIRFFSVDRKGDEKEGILSANNQVQIMKQMIIDFYGY